MTIFVNIFIRNFIKKSYHSDLKYHITLNTIFGVGWTRDVLACCTCGCELTFWMNPIPYTHAHICPVLCKPTICRYTHAYVCLPPWLATTPSWSTLRKKWILCPCHVITLAPCLPPPLSCPHYAHLLHLQSLTFPYLFPF